MTEKKNESNKTNKVNNTLNLDLSKLIDSNKESIYNLIGDEVYERYIDYDNIESFNNPLKNLIYIYNMQGQVDNGGVTQFVDNSTGDSFEETLIALKDIDMPEYVAVLEKIKQTFPNNHIPKNMEERRKVIDNLTQSEKEEWVMEELYERFDDTFYKNQKKFQTKVVEYTKKQLSK